MEDPTVLSDNLPYGDTFIPKAHKHTFRVLGQNINGIFTDDDFEHRPKTIFESFRKKGAAVIGLTEPNCDFQDRRCTASFNKHIRHKTTFRHWSSSSAAKGNNSKNSTYLPGGTATIIRNHWATRFNEAGGDTEMGRWSYVTLNMDDNETLLYIITVYRVGDQAIDPTSNTASMQQRRLLQSQHIATDPREQCMIDLNALITSIHAAGHKVIITMDANENLDDDNSYLNSFLESCDLVCVHEARHHFQTPKTHIRGSKQIDYILCSGTVAPALRGSGFLPFNDGHTSDHRVLWADFHGPTLFGQKTAPVNPPPRRNLNSRNPKTLTPYIGRLGALFKEHKILERTKQLQEDFHKHGKTDRLVQRYQALDKQKTELMVAAEKKSADTRHTSHIPWSPAVKQAALLFRYWDLRLRQHRTKTSYKNTLDSIARAVTPLLQISHHIKMTKPALQDKRRLSLAALKAAQKDAVSLREKFLEERASLYVLTHGGRGGKAGAVKSIKSGEKVSRQFRALNTTFHSAQGDGITSVEVVNPETGLIDVITEPKALQRAMLDSNAPRFHQHDETPFGQGIRSERLGRTQEDSIDTAAILRGEYNHALDELTPEAQAWLKHLQTSAPVASGQQVDLTITPQDFVDAWMKYRESTASNPILHYGHYRAAAVAYKIKPTIGVGEEEEPNPLYNPDFAIVHSIMCELPLRYGFAPDRWQMSINAMLVKASGSLRVDKLRIIHLLEADFNFVLKLIWGKRLIAFCEDRKLLSDDNAGGRHGQSAHDPSLVKTLALDITRLSKTCIILVDNDAKGCYDRIIKNLAMVACIANGLPPSAANMHNMIHDGMVHYVKTAHGISKAFYKATHAGKYSEGSGQGSGASPCIWLIYSDSMLKTLRERSKGMHFHSPNNAHIIDISAMMYVDDNTPGVNDMDTEHGMSLEQLFSAATTTAQTWERILFASGGSLELTKCFTTVIAWDWSTGIPRMLQPNEYNSRVSITRGNDRVPHTLRSNPPELGERTLGVRPAPDGNWNDEFTHRLKQAKVFARQLRGSQHGRDTYHIAYRSIIKTAMTYPLCTTSLTSKQCATIDRAIRPALLPAFGFARNFPVGIATGPSALGGLDIHTTEIEQGLRKVVSLAGHLRQGGRAASTLHIAIDWCQLIAGVSYPILQKPHKIVPHEEPCWIISLRGFLSRQSLSIELTSTWVESPQRIGDYHIMEKLGPPLQRAPKKAMKLNYCRMWLRVSRISDIVHPDGKTILPGALSGQQLPHRRSRLHWPRIPRPPQAFWSVWKKEILTILSCDGKLPILRYPLGEWNHHRIANEWQHLYDPTTDQLLTRDTDWTGYRPHPAVGSTHLRNRRFGSPPIGTFVVPSSAAVPVLASRVHGGTFSVIRPSPIIPSPPPAVAPTTFREYIDAQPYLIRRLLFDLRLDEDTSQAVSKRLESSKALEVATDGSVKYEIGAFAWVFDFEPNIRIRCSGPVDATSADIDPKRAELYGILSVLTFLKLVIAYYSTPARARIRIYCDEVNTTNELDDFINMQQYDSFATTKRCCANYDIIDEILVCIKQLPVVAKIIYIQGHQDRNTPVEELPEAAQLNTVADGMAKRQVQRLVDAIATFDNPRHFPEHQCSVLYKHRRITGPLRNRLRTICYTPGIEAAWAKKFEWTKYDLDSIHHKAFSQVYLNLPKADQRRITQFRCDWLPVNKRCSKWMKDRTEDCPCCNAFVTESVDHLLRCPRNTVHTGELYDSLKTSMTDAKFHPVIIKAILNNVTRWFFPSDIYPDPHTPPPECVQDAIHAQDSIGWGNFLRGFVAIQWIEADEELNATRHDTPFATRMGARMIRPCLQYFLRRWVARNAAIHGGTKQEQEAKQQIIRHRRIDEYCEASYRLLPRDRKTLFLHSGDQVKTMKPAKQKNWLAFANTFFPTALARSQARQDGQTHITDYIEQYNPNEIPASQQDNADANSTAVDDDMDSIAILRAYYDEFDARIAAEMDTPSQADQANFTGT